MGYKTILLFIRVQKNVKPSSGTHFFTHSLPHYTAAHSRGAVTFSGLCFSLKEYLCFCKVCDINLLNEALGAYLHNIQQPKFKMGVPNHFIERWWGMKIFSIFKMGYENFFDYVKLSSALVPRIKNDHSLTGCIAPIRKQAIILKNT